MELDRDEGGEIYLVILQPLKNDYNSIPTNAGYAPGGSHDPVLSSESYTYVCSRVVSQLHGGRRTDVRGWA